MTPDTSINIGDHFEEFTSDLVQKGRFSKVSEAVRAGLELLEAQELKVKALRQAIEDGETSGFPDAPFDFERDWRLFHARLARWPHAGSNGVHALPSRGADGAGPA